MDCPSCSEKTITFSQWKKARNAFIWTCPNCQAKLRANKMVIMPFVVALVLVVSFVVGYLLLFDEALNLSKTMTKVLLIAGSLVIAAPLAALSWFKGGYVEKK